MKVTGKSVKFIDGLWHLCAGKQGYSVIHLHLAGREGWRVTGEGEETSSVYITASVPQTCVLFLIK